jgi:hypothetical protein
MWKLLFLQRTVLGRTEQDFIYRYTTSGPHLTKAVNTGHTISVYTVGRKKNQIL